MDSTQINFINLGQSGLLPQEEMLDVKKSNVQMVIGVLKETCDSEHRVALVPEAVSLLIRNGYRILVESNAGVSAHFPNDEYVNAGAEIIDLQSYIFTNSDILLRISPLSFSEIDLLKPNQTIISALHPTTQNQEYFNRLSDKKVIAIAFEMVQDQSNSFPIVRAVSEIAGNTSILIAAQYLSDLKYGKGNMLGGFSGITPTEVVILGAGTVGEYAARAAMSLGAMVKIFDNNIYKLRRLQENLNARIFTSIIQPKVLLKSLRTAQVVIGALHGNNGRSPVVVSEEMVKEMKKGSVIIDVSIDQGGCIATSRATSHADPVFQYSGITHYCVPNIASRVPHTASYALSNYLAPVILNICESGGTEWFVKSDPHFRKGVYVFKGYHTHRVVCELFKLPYQDIDLLTYSW
ncbi:MAG: alanine dehydrogenase [Bacteroidota bacterium]